VLIAPAIRDRLAGNRDIGLVMIDLEHHLLSTAGPLKVGDGVMVCAEHGLGAVGGPWQRLVQGAPRSRPEVSPRQHSTMPGLTSTRTEITLWSRLHAKEKRP
jgi:hypothetical protein